MSALKSQVGWHLVSHDVALLCAQLRPAQREGRGPDELAETLNAGPALAQGPQVRLLLTIIYHPSLLSCFHLTIFALNLLSDHSRNKNRN